MGFNIDFGGSGGSRNAFRCPHCKEVTSHIQVGFAEYDSERRTSNINRLAGVSDTLGLTKLHNTLFGCKFWKCAKCAIVHERDSSGKLDDIRLDATMSDGAFGWKEYSSGVYHGRIFNFERHGHGVLEFSNGDVYDGEWQDDKMHGRGKYTWASGDSYDGEWNNGNRHGHGEYTWADGTKNKGVWVNDKLDHWL